MANKILQKRVSTQANLLAGVGGYNVGEFLLALDVNIMYYCISATASPSSFIPMGKASDDLLKLAIANNLSDLQDVAAARTNLNVYSKTETDNLLAGLSWKPAVKVATTANVVLSAPQTVDGIVLVVGDRILVKNQTLPADNGIYVVNAAAWTRSTDADSSNEIDAASVFVEMGTANADTAWVLSTDVPIVLGTTALSFVKFAGNGVDTKQIKVSATDTTEGYLDAKITIGATNTGVKKTKNFPAANENLQIDLDFNGMTTLATAVTPATDLIAVYSAGMKKITVQNAVKDVIIDGGSF